MGNKKDYHVIAKFYDHLMGEKKYRVWSALIQEIVEKYGVSKGGCLDLCCGTGNITKILLDLGYSPVGIDNSEQMIEIARDKFPDTTFLCCDVQNFDLPQKEIFPFAVSFYDSLNYILSDEEMLATFRSTWRNMSPGGIFLFDMNPQEHIAVSQKNKPRVFENEDFYCVFRFGGEDRIWKLSMDFFVKQDSGDYRLYREEHVERAYNKEDIVPLLETAGFEVLEVRTENKIYEDKQEHLSRLYFVARKKG